MSQSQFFGHPSAEATDESFLTARHNAQHSGSQSPQEFPSGPLHSPEAYQTPSRYTVPTDYELALGSSEIRGLQADHQVSLDQHINANHILMRDNEAFHAELQRMRIVANQQAQQNARFEAFMNQTPMHNSPQPASQSPSVRSPSPPHSPHSPPSVETRPPPIPSVSFVPTVLPTFQTPVDHGG